MNKPQSSQRSERVRLLAQIHIARKDLRMDDDAYRLMLVTETGQDSCSGLSEAKLRVVLQRLQQSGWTPKRRMSPTTRGKRYKTLADKIRAMWINMARSGIVEDGSENALDAWVKHQTARRNNGIGVDRVEWLDRDPKMATMVLESLKRWHGRVMSSWQNEDLRLVSQEQARLDMPQADVVRQLLSDRRIFWWPLFLDLNVEPAVDYSENRRLLRHE